MAPSQNKKSFSFYSKDTFTNAMHAIARQFSLFTAFDDFLTLTIASFTQNLHNGLSYYESEYLETIAKYKDSDFRYEISKALSYLIREMEERFGALQGNDVLGEFFEEHISNGKNGQYFTPFPLCKMMVAMVHADKKREGDFEPNTPLRILDAACGSGRMLLASHQHIGTGHEYYGIDIDRTCAKMTAVNLFLHGVWNSEVLCANALLPEDFVIAYRISLFPLGIFKIEVKEHSKLWQLQQHSFAHGEKPGTDSVLHPTQFSERPKKDDTQQLYLF